MSLRYRVSETICIAHRFYFGTIDYGNWFWFRDHPDRLHHHVGAYRIVVVAYKPRNDCMYLDLQTRMHVSCTLWILIRRRLRCAFMMCLGGIYVAAEPSN